MDYMEIIPTIIIVVSSCITIFFTILAIKNLNKIDSLNKPSEAPRYKEPYNDVDFKKMFAEWICPACMIDNKAMLNISKLTVCECRRCQSRVAIEADPYLQTRIVSVESSVIKSGESLDEKFHRNKDLTSINAADLMKQIREDQV